MGNILLSIHSNSKLSYSHILYHCMGSGPRKWLFKIGTQRYFAGLPQYMKNDSAAGKSTTLSPKNGQENLKHFLLEMLSS